MIPMAWDFKRSFDLGAEDEDDRDEEIDLNEEDHEDEEDEEIFNRSIPTLLREHLLSLSERGAVGYVESEIGFGFREDSAIVWKNREIAFGPLTSNNAMDEALRFFGVEAQEESCTSEGWAIGLWDRDETEEWLLSDEEWQKRLDERQYQADVWAAKQQILFEAEQNAKKWWQFWR